ncbi:hypothetical protein HYV64_01630 [Candidatus Shapirobacteria bacterium]|nr:hypothetical protein [Candidatus Shapirobacteria bacterium]
MSDLNINTCRICHQPITKLKPASRVMIRDGRAQVGANVHVGDCQRDKSVVHSVSTSAALPALRLGYIHRTR